MSTNSQRAEGPPWTIMNLLTWTSGYLKKHLVENPRASAEVMLAHCLGCKRIDLYLRHDQPMQKEELAQFRKLVKRRVAGEPVAYIVGCKEFWSLEFKVDGSVLIPRPDSECLVETAVLLFADRPDLKVLELGCGSGAISIAMAHERPGWRFLALDRSYDAIRVARANARHHHLDERIQFMVSDWFAALGNSKFDLIVTNPPYIKTEEIDTLPTEIRCYEPRLALDGGIDGTASLSLIIRSSPSYMVSGGVMVTEIGSDQRPAVCEIVRKCSRYRDIDFKKDFGGLDRVAVLTSS